jgi:hypothetical protein
VLTGHGLKDPETALAQLDDTGAARRSEAGRRAGGRPVGSIIPCDPELAAIERAVLE